MQASAEATARRRAAVVRVWYMLAVGGLAVFSLHAIHGFGGRTVDDFFNRTLYNALILLAVVGCALRVVWVRAERGAWLALTIAVAMWATGEILFALSGWRPGRLWTLMGGALAASAIADGIFLYQTARGSYVEGTVLDALWPAAMLLLAAAAWQPTPRAASIELEGRPLLATPAGCGVLAIGVLLYDRYHPLHALAPMLAVATLAAVLVRTGLTFRENSRILARIRRQAVTDALTGLSNRRKLLEDLEQALGRGPGAEELVLVV